MDGCVQIKKGPKILAEIWFSSDHHFRHENTWRKFKKPCETCKGKKIVSDSPWSDEPDTCPDCNGAGQTPLRPFQSTKEMDQRMIEEHNKLVKPSDHWYCLGDISMMRPRFVREQVTAMNGHKRLIRGNHDIFKSKEYMEVGFEELYGMRYIDGICFTHFPIHPRSVGRYAGVVHGHIHDGPNLPPAVWVVPESGEKIVCPYLNITVEHTDYKPLSLDQIKTTLKELREKCLSEL